MRLLNSNLKQPAEDQLPVPGGSLARNPTKNGSGTVANHAALLARKGDTVSALQDIWWAVLNSNEFIINH